MINVALISIGTPFSVSCEHQRQPRSDHTVQESVSEEGIAHDNHQAATNLIDTERFERVAQSGEVA